jgi:hypothetical protein
MWAGKAARVVAFLPSGACHTLCEAPEARLRRPSWPGMIAMLEHGEWLRWYCCSALGQVTLNVSSASPAYEEPLGLMACMVGCQFASADFLQTHTSWLATREVALRDRSTEKNRHDNPAPY